MDEPFVTSTDARILIENGSARSFFISLIMKGFGISRFLKKKDNGEVRLEDKVEDSGGSHVIGSSETH
jgi:hypothetical protein